MTTTQQFLTIGLVILTATSINAPIDLALCGVVGTAVSKAVLKLSATRTL